MAITILEIVALFCFLILPLAGPLKKKKPNYKRPDKGPISTRYGINEAGEIEQLLNKQGKKEDF
jgi:hypothetical protein